MSDIISMLGYVAELFWSLFSDLLGFITDNPIVLFAVCFGILGSAVLMVIAFIRRFGVRVGGGRRRRRR